MSENAARPRLRPDPLDVFRFADAAAELRYRLVLNYLHADLEAGEPPVPPVARRVFNRLLHLTRAINDGRPEDQKPEGHIVEARDLVWRFGQEWLGADHRTRLRSCEAAREGINELTEYDWAEIRRHGPFDPDVQDVPTVAGAYEEALRGSPFRAGAWGEYEAAVERFVGTFDPPCRTLYGLVRALAAVRYPDPATYDGALGTLPVYDDDHLIGHVFPAVRQRLTDLQAQTCLSLNLGAWFDAANPHHSITALFGALRTALRGWGGEAPVPPELDRPRWQPAGPGAKNLGVLSFRGRSTAVARQSKVVAPVLKAFEDGGWLLPVPFPPGNDRPKRTGGHARPRTW